MPAFLIGEPSNAGRYFKKAARVREEYLFNGFARVFRQQRRIGESCLNDTACCEVWLSEEKDAAILGRDVLIEKMVAFAEDYKRWGGEGNPNLRRTEHMDADPDMKRTDITVDGLKRFWYTYEPSAYKRGMKTKYPLVIAIHGFSCSAEFFAENSGWAKVAEDRGCLVVFPNAYPFDDALRGGIAATPHWNTQGDPAENGPNEIAYFQRLLEVVKEAYPIDTERVYVTGHSNGSMMAQRLMRHWPAPFAGFAPVGLMEEARAGALPAPTDGIIRNPWYVVGEYDIHTSSLAGDNPNTRTLKMICEADHLDYASAAASTAASMRTRSSAPLTAFPSCATPACATGPTPTRPSLPLWSTMSGSPATFVMKTENWNTWGKEKHEGSGFSEKKPLPLQCAIYHFTFVKIIRPALV